MFHLTEGIKRTVNYSWPQLAFSLLLAFDLDLKISTLENLIRKQTFTPEEALDILGKATIDTGQVINND